MANLGTAIGLRASSSCSRSEPLALIACGDPRERIGRILDGEKLGFDAFDDVDALLHGYPPDEDPALILVWVEDTESRVASAIEPLTRRFAQTPLTVICSRVERWTVRAVLSAGASGVILTVDLDSALGPCVKAMQAGQICVPRAFRGQIEPPALSSREKQILGLVVMSYTNSQIAQHLFLAESTVKSHLSSAFGKLGVRSRNEAVDLILDRERGLGIGILALGGEPVEATVEAAPSLASGSC